MKDGTVGWNPGVLNPNIVRPAGPIDPELALVLFEQPAANARGAPLAAYVNYAVHLDNVGGTGISADMPSVIAEAMSSGRGRDLITIYTSGCCGDINHIDVTNGERQQGPGMAHRMGTILAAELFKLWPKLPPASTGSLAVRTTMVKLPLAPVSESQIEKARGVAARADAAAGQPTNSLPPFMEMVDAYKTLDVVEQDGKPIEVEVQAIALGTDVAWVSLPGEIFVELGMAIKKRSPFPRTIIAELANGTIGYIPTRRAYPHGNYEVVSARVAEGSGEMLVNAAVALLEALHKNSASK
jgi:hypothetical protein